MKLLMILFFGVIALHAFAASSTSTYPDVPPPFSVKKGNQPKVVGGLAQGVEIGLHLSVKQITPRLFLITHTFPYPANAVLVEMENKELVLVDTTFFNDSAEDLLSWIQNKFGKRSITAINTHFHVDRVGGNAALIKKKIPVYGSDQIAPLLKEKGAAMRDVMVSLAVTDPMKNVYKKMVFTPPDHSFPLKEGKTLKFGNEEVQIRFVGAGHTSDNVVVYFPSQKILVGGSLVIAGKTVGNTLHANLVEWPQSVKALSEFKATYVIPGRGLETGPQLITHTLEVLEKNKTPSSSKYIHKKVVIAPL